MVGVKVGDDQVVDLLQAAELGRYGVTANAIAPGARTRMTENLGLGAIEKRPKVMAGPDGEDVIAVRTCAYFSLSFDHRVIDGAMGAKFLQTLRGMIEEPVMMVV